MDFQSITPISPLFQNGVNSSENIQNLGEIAQFSDIFKSAIENVKTTDEAKNEAQYLLATGQLDNPATLTIAATQAAVSVELLVELRNRALDAYSELMRISL